MTDETRRTSRISRNASTVKIDVRFNEVVCRRMSRDHHDERLDDGNQRKSHSCVDVIASM